ncbi:MAG: hypothetical protein ACOC7N_02585 [Chloroflexota bacterium]
MRYDPPDSHVAEAEVSLRLAFHLLDLQGNGSPVRVSIDGAQLSRRQPHVLSEESNAGAYVATAEDIVLSKLEGYRMGGPRHAGDRSGEGYLYREMAEGDREVGPGL